MFRPLLSRQATQVIRTRQRNISVQTLHTIDEWISTPKKMAMMEGLHPERAADLFITLPTRDGVRAPYREPVESEPLGYGHHIGYFHNRVPESRLKEDGTDGEYAPPSPFDRRMWAGGSMSWNNSDPLLLGERVIAQSEVTSIQKKGFEKDKPMLFLNQTIQYTAQGKETPGLVEDRVHVYLPAQRTTSGAPRPVLGLPSSHDFSFTYTPTLTTLFRFSALMFNAHHIHLDKDYTQQSEGYPERLVHGPLTALMLLEAVTTTYPGNPISRYEYRARNPLPVGPAHTIYGKKDGRIIELWCKDETGVVGMTGRVFLEF